MDSFIDVTIPVDEAAARALQDPACRAAAGRYLSILLRTGGLQILLADAIADTKAEARANGMTDADIDTELEEWRAHRAR